MSFEPRKKVTDGGPILKRDKNNKLDRDDAAKVTDNLVKKLLTEQRAHEKEISFNARGNKRDFVVMVTVLQRNSIDGHIAIGDDESKGFTKMDEGGTDPFKYRVYDFVEAPILAKHIPMNRAAAGKQMLGIFNVLVNYLGKLGIVDTV